MMRTGMMRTAVTRLVVGRAGAGGLRRRPGGRGRVTGRAYGPWDWAALPGWHACCPVALLHRPLAPPLTLQQGEVAECAGCAVCATGGMRAVQFYTSILLRMIVCCRVWTGVSNSTSLLDLVWIRKDASACSACAGDATVPHALVATGAARAS